MKKKIIDVCVIMIAFFVILLIIKYSASQSYDVSIVVPANSHEDYVFSEEEISPSYNTITIYAGKGCGDTMVALQPVEPGLENTCDVPTYLTPGMPVKMSARKGAWYKIGISQQNESPEDVVVYVTMEGVEVRIE